MTIEEINQLQIDYDNQDSDHIDLEVLAIKYNISVHEVFNLLDL